MIYQGQAISVSALDLGIIELKFDLQGESINKFNRATLTELGEAVKKIKQDDSVRGMIVTSGKDVFIVGADIKEFGGIFSSPEDELAGWALKANEVFSAIEDLPFPTVTAINGLALGGGLEMCLATDFRVMSSTAQIGLPEVKLGIFPGFGGTVRLPRLIGVDNAVEWIASGGQHKSEKALKDGVVDAMVAPEQLNDAAKKLVMQCVNDKIDYLAHRKQKLEPLKLPPLENMMSFQTCIALVSQKAGKHYPSPVAAVKAMQQHSSMKRDQALEVEAKNFAKMAKTKVAANLIGLFLNDQELKKQNKVWSKKAQKVERAAVLGAGIMGGGIAYQSASKGVPIVMKDIAESALDLGMSEANKLLQKRVDRGKMTTDKMAKVLSSIRPTLSYSDFDQADIIVEAVVENEAVKQKVLAETETHLKENTILASNTSTISISKLATSLKRPQNFVGMHFFNPVHRMPLVEVIRGQDSSEEAIATTVAYAQSIGKTPVVVNDCPGFFVNRVLFPYLGAFSMLLRDGGDFKEMDKVMERFGWPMGPAYLMDVVGIDTGVHAAQIMAQGFPERMQYDFKDAFTYLYEQKRYGQKNGLGFYRYEIDKKGKPKKIVDESVPEMLRAVCDQIKPIDKEEVIHRLMIPMCLETVRCLEEGIVGSVADADMALILGVGFPPYLGGALRYLDELGLSQFVELCDKYKASLGSLYEPTEKLRSMAEQGQLFYAR